MRSGFADVADAANSPAMIAPARGLQSHREMFLIVDKDQILRRGRFHTGHGTHLGAAVANQAGSDRLSNLLQRALHGSHCIAARSKEGRADGTKGSVKDSPRLPPDRIYGTVQVFLPWHMMKVPWPTQLASP